MSQDKNRTDLRDLHIYGGIALVAVGAAGYFGWQGALIVVGLAAWYMGIWRMGRL